MLKKYQQDKGLTIESFSKEIGISKDMLLKIYREKSPKISYAVAYKVYLSTGLHPWEYLNGLEDLQKLHVDKFNR